jgi:hypothetical protein
LGIHFLVLFAVGGGADGAVEDLDRSAAPAPVRGGLAFETFGEADAQLAKEGLRQLGAGLAVGAGVDRARLLAQAQAPDQGAGDGGGAGLGGGGALPEEGPQGKDRGPDGVGLVGEGNLVTLAGLRDVLLAEEGFVGPVQGEGAEQMSEGGRSGVASGKLGKGGGDVRIQLGNLS